MYVRLAFSVAAHLDTEILAIDEVLAVGDAEFQRRSIAKMREAASGGRTVLYVSHQLQTVQALCTSAMLLDRGSLVYSGTVDGTLDAYRNSFEKFALAQSDPANRPGNGRLRIGAVSMGDEFVKSGDDLVIDFEAPRADDLIGTYFVSAHINNDQGSVIAQCDSRLVGKWFDPDEPQRGGGWSSAGSGSSPASTPWTSTPARRACWTPGRAPGASRCCRICRIPSSRSRPAPRRVWSSWTSTMRGPDMDDVREHIVITPPPGAEHAALAGHVARPRGRGAAGAARHHRALPADDLRFRLGHSAATRGGAGIFTIVFGVIAGLSTGKIPTFLFTLAGGMLAWNLFSGSLNRASSSMVSNQALVQKVFFPRALVPLSSLASLVVDFAVGLVLAIVLLFAFGINPGWPVLLLPVWVLLMLLIGTGIGLAAAAYMVKYRDVGYVLPWVVQILLYASPVAYALSAVPNSIRWLFDINPATWFLESFRWSLLGTEAPPDLAGARPCDRRARHLLPRAADLPEERTRVRGLHLMRVTAYVLVADPAFLRESIRAYYDRVERIVLSYDETSTSWTGTPLPVAECLRLIEEVDPDGKCVHAPGPVRPDR